MNRTENLRYENQKIILQSGNKSYRAVLTLVCAKQNRIDPADCGFLTAADLDYIRKIKNPGRRYDCILGRFAAKNAASVLLGIKMRDITIEKGVFDQPIVRNKKDSGIQVTISHIQNYGLSVSYTRELILGADMERSDHRAMEAVYLSAYERRMADHMECSKAVIWTAREALLKCLKAGIYFPQRLLELDSVRADGGTISGTYRYFRQYVFQAYDFGKRTVAIAYPSNVKCNLNLSELHLLQQQTI